MRCTRRQMILGLLGTGATGLCPGVRAASAGRRAWELEPDRWRALAAATERILPGAREAGVPAYLQYWLAREPFDRAPDWGPLLKIGAVRLDALARQAHGQVFADCGPEQQDTILKRFQQGEVIAKGFGSRKSRAFFQRLVVLTLEGFLSEPKYGGNRDGVGFGFIGKKPCWWAHRQVWRLLHPAGIGRPKGRPSR